MNREEDEDMWNAEADATVLDNPGEVLEVCMDHFGRNDFIMEPLIFNQLKR
jgi:hypothetical protein